MAKGRTETTRRWLWRAWWELRFIGQAFLHREFEDPRVQRLVDEKLRKDGIRA